MYRFLLNNPADEPGLPLSQGDDSIVAANTEVKTVLKARKKRGSYAILSPKKWAKIGYHASVYGKCQYFLFLCV